MADVTLIGYEGEVNAEAFGIRLTETELQVPQGLLTLLQEHGVEEPWQVYRMVGATATQLRKSFGIAPHEYFSYLTQLCGLLPPEWTRRPPGLERGMGYLVTDD